MKPLIDSYQRPIRKLRISVTDHCNLRCHYCMPEEGLRWLKQADILSYEEIHRLSKLFVSMGIQHIRLTGGEPLMRKDLPSLVSLLNLLKKKGLKSIGLTTNGILLEDQLPLLKEAGLDHVNVSLDTVNPELFYSITKRDVFDRVQAGLQKLAELYPEQSKINAVIQRGVNEEEVRPLLDFAKKLNMELRFIENMPLEAQGDWQAEKVVSGQEILEALASTSVPPEDHRGSSPAETYWIKNRQQKVGFINSVTEPFCASCDRIRLTADGALRNCLFATWETDLKNPLRKGASDSELETLIRDNISKKWAGHRINQKDFQPASRSMSQVGG